jgi:DNA-binding response OmpR family regulator
MENTQQNKKVVIIEDDEQFSRVYSIRLQQDGIQTVLAQNGEEGLAKIIAEKPDLVLLDLMLPKKDGFWVLEEVRKDPAVSGIPIIVLSNLGQKSDTDRAKKLGATDYLVKADVSIQQIAEAVKKYLFS